MDSKANRQIMRRNAALHRAGRLSACDWLEQTIECIEQDNHKINAFTELDFAKARALANASDRRRSSGISRGALDGVPFAIKDNVDVEGLQTGNGLGGGAAVASATAPSIERLFDAGAILLGKLNMHEAALGATTDNPHTGKTHNPLALGFTPGGSSGGSAAAVAAGFCHFAIGSDTLGSVRLPAAYCGLVGFLPSRGTVPMNGVVPLARELDQLGPISQTVAGVVEAFAALSGQITPSYQSSELHENGKNLWQFVAASELYGVDQHVAEVYFATIARLKRSGFAIDTEPMDWLQTLATTRKAALVVIEREAYEFFQVQLQSEAGAFSDELRALLDFGRRLAPDRLELAHRQMRQARDQLNATTRGGKIILLPTAPQTAFAFDSPTPVNQAELTGYANIAGCPAIALPLTKTVDANAMPYSLQLIAERGADSVLLSAALALEPNL